MSQKVQIEHCQSHDATGAQPVNGPQFQQYRDSADFSLVQPQGGNAGFSEQNPVLTGTSADNIDNVLVTVLMPCLNEARTLAACIQQAHSGCQAALAARNISRHAMASGSGPASLQTNDGQSRTTSTQEFTYEILISDNCSTDDSPEIATANGARVVQVEQKGYGAALRGGIVAAQGKYIVMGDSDCSYDFGEVPHFIDKLEEGFDLVIGNRFAGGIMPGAMPWHHRYIGNPVLSGIGRFLYHTPCKDWHCGLRAFDRKKIRDMDLQCTGMDFASEMTICAARHRLQSSELPVTLHPDGRNRPPHLNSFRDGWAHLRLILSKAFLFLLLLLLGASIAGVAIASNPNNCQKPNPNKKACHVPVGGVLDCTTLSTNPDQCTGTKQYDIKLFPDGAVGDPYSGRWTKDQAADCYRYATCKINELTGSCQNLDGYGNWFQMPQTVLDTNRVCPPPPGTVPGPPLGPPPGP